MQSLAVPLRQPVTLTTRSESWLCHFRMGNLVGCIFRQTFLPLGNYCIWCFWHKNLSIWNGGRPTENTAEAIYKRSFWDPPQLQQINWENDCCLEIVGQWLWFDSSSSVSVCRLPSLWLVRIQRHPWTDVLLRRHRIHSSTLDILLGNSSSISKTDATTKCWSSDKVFISDSLSCGEVGDCGDQWRTQSYSV